jgi:predicted butyrate kinase (DUF1464 family)
MTVRVAGTDPGTSSLDLVVLQDGAVIDQARFTAPEVQADPPDPLRWLQARAPFDLVAGPSGYGLPLVRAADCTPHHLALMTLVRPNERAPDDPRRRGVPGFAHLLRALSSSSLPILFLPGVIHLPTVPEHRKINRVDLGTADKLCVAALALARRCEQRGLAPHSYSGCVVELGSSFTACVALHQGQVVDSLGGSSGPPGWCSPGAWDGEAAYLLSPLAKRDLFTGGALAIPDPQSGRAWFRESLLKAVAGLRALTPFDEVVLSGRLLETEPALADEVTADLGKLANVVRLDPLPGAWVKHAAQGAAVLADGLAGGRFAALVERLALRQTSGTSLDHLHHPRAAEVRGWF